MEMNLKPMTMDRMLRMNKQNAGLYNNTEGSKAVGLSASLKTGRQKNRPPTGKVIEIL